MSHKTSSAVARIVLSARLTGIYPLQVTSAGFHGGTWAYWGNSIQLGQLLLACNCNGKTHTMNRIVPIMLGVLFAVLLALALWLFAGLPLLPE